MSTKSKAGRARQEQVGRLWRAILIRLFKRPRYYYIGSTRIDRLKYKSVWVTRPDLLFRETGEAAILGIMYEVW